MTLDIEDYLVFLWWWPTKVLNHPLWFTVHYILVWHFHTLMTLKCNAERYLTGQLDRETLNLSEEGIHINFSMTLFVSLQLAHWRPADSPKSREGREGTLFLQRVLHDFMGMIDKMMTVLICLCLCFLHQYGGGWRFIRGVAVSLGTLWWRFGGSCRGRHTIFLSRPVCRWGDVVAAALTRPWSVFPRSHTHSPWRYRHTDTL